VTIWSRLVARRNGGTGLVNTRVSVLLRTREQNRRIDGRLVIILAVGAYLAVVAIARLVWHVDIWPRLGVPSGPSLFYDARNVAAAAECRQLGYDPLVDNPCDPSGRPMNYPRIWLLLRFMGLHESQTLIFGTVIILLFLASILLLMGRLSLSQGALVAMAVCSPAVMLAVERANMDLVLFSVFVLAVFMWRARATMPLSPTVVLFAAVAKLYAVFALLAFVVIGGRRVRWAIAACFAFLGIYGVATLRDIKAISGAPEGGLLYSYGVRILPGYLYHQVVPAEWRGGMVAAQAIAVVPFLVVAVAVSVQARRRLSPVLSHAVGQWSPALLAFLLGALVYLGTFAARKNGDYRLVFLLLTVPQLLTWVASDVRATRAVARAALASVLAGLWVGALSRYAAPFDELASWAIATLFVALLAGLVPRIRTAGLPDGTERAPIDPLAAGGTGAPDERVHQNPHDHPEWGRPWRREHG
jgi:hypothetical protein